MKRDVGQVARSMIGPAMWVLAVALLILVVFPVALAAAASGPG